MPDPTGPQALAAYVKADPTSPFVLQCWAEAADLVGGYVGEAESDVPDSVLRRAKVEVGAELYYRQNAPSGVLQQATEFGGTATRVARDPLVPAYPLLRRWVGGGFG